MGKHIGKNGRGQLRPRLRVMVGEEIALGPGRVDLLGLIAETGSLTAAASHMGVSYMRAWKLVKSTNRCFREPIVEVARGGRTGGGARLTKSGKRVTKLYRKMEKQCETAVKRTWGEMRKLLAC